MLDKELWFNLQNCFFLPKTLKLHFWDLFKYLKYTFMSDRNIFMKQKSDYTWYVSNFQNIMLKILVIFFKIWYLAGTQVKMIFFLTTDQVFRNKLIHDPYE